MNKNSKATETNHDVRIAILEVSALNQREDTNEIKEAIKIIKDNHLTHIQDSIKQIELTLASLTPQNSIVYKAIEYLVMAIIIAGVTLLLRNFS